MYKCQLFNERSNHNEEDNPRGQRHGAEEQEQAVGPARVRLEGPVWRRFLLAAVHRDSLGAVSIRLGNFEVTFKRLVKIEHVVKIFSAVGV